MNLGASAWEAHRGLLPTQLQPTKVVVEPTPCPFVRYINEDLCGSVFRSPLLIMLWSHLLPFSMIILSSQTESLDCKDSHAAPVFSTTRTVTSATLLHHGHPRGHLPPGGIGPPPEAVQQALRRLSSLRAFRIYRALDTPSSQPMPQQPFRGAQSWHHTTARDECNPTSSIASHLGASEIRPIPSDPAPRPSSPVQLVSHERGSHP